MILAYVHLEIADSIFFLTHRDTRKLVQPLVLCFVLLQQMI